MKENSLVIVTGMELPENCYSCRFNYDRLCHALQCSFYNSDDKPREKKGGRLVNCPLKPVVRGEWVGRVDECPDGNVAVVGWYCSVCGEYGHDDFNFCPNCGADMRKEENDGNV